jgi:hypothetical protein
MAIDTYMYIYTSKTSENVQDLRLLQRCSGRFRIKFILGPKAGLDVSENRKNLSPARIQTPKRSARTLVEKVWYVK